MIFNRRSLVVGETQFKSEDTTRPYIAVGNENLPFSHNEQIFVAISTSGYEDAIKITDDDISQGKLPVQSYVLPWNILILKDYQIEQKVGEFSEEFIDEVVSQVENYIN